MNLPHSGRGHHESLFYDQPRQRSAPVVLGVGAAALASLLLLQSLVATAGVGAGEPAPAAAVGEPPVSPSALVSPVTTDPVDARSGGGAELPEGEQGDGASVTGSSAVGGPASPEAGSQDAAESGATDTGVGTGSTLAGVAVPAVGFAVGAVTPDSSALPTIDQVAALVLELDASVVVTGHADASGDAGLELELSRRRAAVVAELLVTRGVPAGRISLDPRGAAEAAQVSGDAPGTATGNRRVTFAVETS